MPSGRKSARRGRVDYKKLSTGVTDWRPLEELSSQKPPVKAKESKGADREKLSSATVETYLLMLYVTLEQETAVKELFQDRKWPFLKSDLSALTEETGPTALNHNKEGNIRNKTASKPKNTRQMRDEAENIPKATQDAEADNDDIVGDSDMDMIDDDDDDYSPPLQTPSKKRKRSPSPTPSKNLDQQTLMSKESEEPKLQDSNEDVTNKNKGEVITETEQEGDNVSTEEISEVTPEVNTKPSRRRRARAVSQSKKTSDNNDTSNFATKDHEAKISENTESATVEIVEKDEGPYEELTADTLPDEDIEEIELDKRCWECDEILTDVNEYAKHMMKQHSFDVKTGRYYCETCDKYFKQPEYLKDHNKHVHEGAKRKPQKTTRDHICDICGRSFKRPDQLKEHRSMVHFKTPLNTHECDICGKKFARPKLLGYHMNKHIGSKPYQCTTCGNSYFSRGGLYVHSRMCKKLDPLTFKCEICQKNFSNQYALKVHMVGIHSKTQPAYRCSCGKLLKWKTSIKKHQNNCPQNAENVIEITREEYDESIRSLTKARIVREEPNETTEIVLQTEDGNIESQVTEVTDEKLVEEITGKIANELSKSGSVNTDDEKMITETIRNAVLSGNETQVITIPRPAGAENEENVYYVIVNPSPDQQI